MMSYLCENEAENIQSGYGYVAQEDAKCIKAQRDNGQCLPD